MIRFTFFIAFNFLFTISLLAQQGGGMWIPNELNEKEMKQMGMEISAKDIFNPNAPSIKDAVAHFNRGCTSEVISPKGLLLTNHHCGFSQIQSHSSLENDYIKDGFWAMKEEEELPNKDLTATFIVDIQDVTQKILQGTEGELDESKRQDIIKSNIDIISHNVVKENYQDVFIKPFYKGNKYYLFITETFKDVRLVGAPPSSIGNFGKDTDNWMWPRHTGDFSLFRIYANQDNKPAEYSPENKPYQPKHFFPISIKGINEGDFTFVFGFPGSTDEYLPSIALEQIINDINPARIGVRDVALKILDKKMRTDDATRIKYASKFARISNYWKKWKGENQGLIKSDAVKKRQELEADFNKKIKENPEWQNEYGNLIEDFNQLYKERIAVEKASTYFDEAIYRNSETFRIALLLNNYLSMETDEARENYSKKIIPYLTNLYKDYDANLDQEVSLALIDLFQKSMPKEFIPTIKLNKKSFNNSIVTGKKLVDNKNLTQQVEQVFSNPNFISQLKKDPIITQIASIKEKYETNVATTEKLLTQEINALQRKYMKAQLEVFNDKKIFPDANSTLRVTYGKVDGYQPEGKPRYNYKTYLDGVIEKYKPGDYEFDVPKKLIELHKNKDYGMYEENGKMPINFIASNHTTGGNSGSPALDKNGNLIGLNFDRVWEGTMSDLNYDPAICRNIMVDIRYILFIIHKYAGANHLINEMLILK